MVLWPAGLQEPLLGPEWRPGAWALRGQALQSGTAVSPVEHWAVRPEHLPAGRRRERQAAAGLPAWTESLVPGWKLALPKLLLVAERPRLEPRRDSSSVPPQVAVSEQLRRECEQARFSTLAWAAERTAEWPVRARIGPGPPAG